MICRKPFKDKASSRNGFLLADLMVGFAIALSFMALIYSISAESEKLYANSHYRNELISDYESNVFVEDREPYGNYFELVRMSDSSSTLDFLRIAKGLESDDSSPLCSVAYGAPRMGEFRSGDAVEISDLRFREVGLNIGAPLTDIVVRNGIAYVSADPVDLSADDIYIVDLATGRTISSLNTGPGISSIAVHANKIYAAALSSANQLHVIRLDGLQNPVLESKHKIPLLGTSTQPRGTATYYMNGNIFLGTEKWDGPELFAYNDNMSASSSYEIGSKINDIFGMGTSTFISSSGNNQLFVINGGTSHSYSPSGFERQEGKTSNMFENRLYFGRTSGGYNVSNQYELFRIGEGEIEESVDMPGGVYGILADKNNIITATRMSGKEIQVFDSALHNRRSFHTDTPEKITCDGEKAYILSKDRSVIIEITFV